MMRNLTAKEHQPEHEQSTSDVQRRGILYKDWMFVDCLDACGQLLPSSFLISATTTAQAQSTDSSIACVRRKQINQQGEEGWMRFEEVK
jgi:hypothetical protein